MCLVPTTQAELFDVCAIRELVEAAVDGYNVTGEQLSCVSHTCVRPQLLQPHEHLVA